MYFNTTNLSGRELYKAFKDASKQDEIILTYMRYQTSLKSDYETSCNVLSQISKFKNTPITSVRRSVNTLVNEGLLEYTGDYQMGGYGKREKKFKLR